MLKTILYLILSFSFLPSTFASLPIEINGYLNAGVTVGTSEKLYLDKFGNEPNFFDETSAGLQFSANIDELWRTVVLFHSQYDQADENLRTKLYMGYVEYKPSHEWNIKVGILPVPVWLISDYYNVGALYPWFRPPPSVFTVNSPEEISGASIENYSELGQGLLRTQVLVGQSKRKNGKPFGKTSSGSYQSRIAQFDTKLITLNTDYRIENFRLRGSYYFGLAEGKTITTTEDRSKPLQVSQNINVSYFPKSYYRMMSAGFSYDSELYSIIGEYANSRISLKSTGERYNNRRGYYLTGKLNLKKWLPHLTFGQYMESRGPVSELQITKGKESILNYSVGLNYHINPQVVIKSQAEFLDIKKKESSTITYFNPGPVEKDQIGIFSLGLSTFF